MQLLEEVADALVASAVALELWPQLSLPKRVLVQHVPEGLALEALFKMRPLPANLVVLIDEFLELFVHHVRDLRP